LKVDGMVEAMKGGGHCIFVSNMEDEDGKKFYVWFFYHLVQ